jgi:HEAT repeat protein
VDLAILVDDPADIAAMLLRLTDDEAGAESRDGALQQKFSDVATLLAALDPPLARVMFSKLARAVLDLGPERRTDLLRRTILPGLLDGRADGAVLRDFPNIDLAESLCLLMDLETAAPELLTTALDRLDLPADRRQVVAPMLEARLRSGEPSAAPAPAGGRQPDIDRHVSRLIRINPSEGKSFADFAAFDLSIDDQTTATLGRIQESISSTDLPVAQLGFLLNLVRLEPNPALADVFLRCSLKALAELERATRHQDLAAWAAQYRSLADALRESRPDVADAISSALAAFCTPDRAMALSDLYARDADGQVRANELVDAFGAATTPAFVALLDDPDMRTRARALVPLMCEHGRLLAPALAGRLGHCSVAAARAIIKVLGFAGSGFEHVLAEQLQHGDEQTAREALQALAHIGSTRAAAIVGVHLRRGANSVRAAAEEALRHFPPAAAAATLRDLLASREFILQHPQVAVRLLDRAEQVGLTDLQPAMRALVPLRFRFWNPALVRVALKARTMIGPR